MEMYEEMMLEFHKAFEVPIAACPALLPAEAALRRITLIESEAGELGDAFREKDLVKAADGIGDLLYVTFGTAVEMGLPIDEIFAQIHRSNMTKVCKDGSLLKDAGGKVLKPATYEPVDLSWLLKNRDRDLDDPQSPSNGYICQDCQYYASVNCKSGSGELCKIFTLRAFNYR